MFGSSWYAVGVQYILVSVFLFTLVFFLLFFRFWGTCADHARLLHRHIHGKVVCGLHPPVTYIWHFSPYYLSPTSPPPAVQPLAPTNKPQCVMLPSLCSRVLIIQHLPMSENMCCLLFCSSVCWEWWFPDSSISLQRTQTHRFLWLHSISWCIRATVSLSSLSSMGIWVGSRSLLL